MPIVDGLTSTKMIRSMEKLHAGQRLSPRGNLYGRLPIFAVSASLVERERHTYMDAGFDGWILKPIDFKRLNILLAGIVDQDVRRTCLYKPGEWERGGWFHKRMKPKLSSPFLRSSSPEIESTGSGDSGSITPTGVAASKQPTDVAAEARRPFT